VHSTAANGDKVDFFHGNTFVTQLMQ
jgi:hypothetical protein